MCYTGNLQVKPIAKTSVEPMPVEVDSSFNSQSDVEEASTQPQTEPGKRI